MSAPIVYEGKLQGHGGTLFKNIKFWVAQRVPMRTTWIQDIENNGGTIVKLDKQADLMIADHAKKDSPSGSYSWKWIEDSVKHGKLMDKEDYLITAPGHESRPVGTVQHKSTRNAFTKQDDLLLTKFVAKHERQGTATSGNVIYKQLEAKYPHHTFQSWRDRWVKKLQFAPRPQLSSSSPSPPPEHVPAPASAVPQPLSRAPTQTPQSFKRAELGNSSSPRKKTRTKFTEEEDKVLLAHVEAIRSEGYGVSGKKVYEGLAHDFPQHTWQAWRDRYLKILRPRELGEAGKESPLPSPVRGGATPRGLRGGLPAARQGLDDADAFRPDTRKYSPIVRDTEVLYPEAASPKSPDEEVQLQSDSNVPFNERREAGNQNAGRDVASVTRQKPDRGAGRDLSPSTSSKSGREIGYSSPAINHDQPFPIDTKETFYEFFTDFLKTETQIDQKDITFWPTIRGQMFELWDLWRVVQSQKAEPAERDWQQIAEDLGFNWTEIPAVPDEIRHYYESHLSSFEEMLMGYVGGASGIDDEDEEEEEEEEENVEPPEPRLPKLPAAQNVLSDSQFNSSPPRQPSLKRTYGAAVSAELAYPDSARKRSRLGRDDEIPSTPDTKNGTSHLRPTVSAGVSPSDRRLQALPRSSQFTHNDSKGKQPELEIEEIEDRVLGLSEQSTSRRVVFEPETQDFGFDPQSQVVNDLQEQSEAEVTPSQQLLSEIDAEERRRELNQTSPIRKRKVKSPFLPDADDDDEEEIIPKPRYGKGPNPLRSHPELLKPHRRSLPASFIKNHSPAAMPARKSVPRSPYTYTQVSSTPARPSLKPRSKAEELAQVVEYWQSLGYSHDIARRSLEATTWEPSLAGRVMQYIKDGNPMPTNWEGVWSPRDDESLRLINSANPPSDEQEAKKRRKAAARLKNKHGDDRMELRKKWLVVKTEL